MAHAACCKLAMAVSSSSSSSSTALTLASGHRAALQGLTMGQNSQLKKYGMAMASGSSLLLPSTLRGTPLPNARDEHKGCWLIERRCGAGVVRASSIGVVKDVKLVSEAPLYYNVTLAVSPTSEVAKWYNTPGQYVDLIPVKSERPNPAAFFISSPVQKLRRVLELEFLIEDVTDTVAHEIVNSKPGERVSITTNTWSTGFDLSELYPIKESESVLMFASGYGLGPFRALIETGFEAKERKHVILYSMFTQEQQPYVDRFPAWEQTGIKIQRGSVPNIISTNPASTVVLMVASVDGQEHLAKYFGSKGVPDDRILTLFGGIESQSKSFYNKVLHKLKHYPKFPHHGEKHVHVALQI